jgi:hypothetical protein
MPQLHIEIDRMEHPLDVVERLASLRDWIFDRAETDEMSVSVSGSWADYHIAFTWIEDVEALHVACAFDLKVPCERYFQAFQFVIWAGKSAREALDSVLFETEGSA